MTIEIVHVLRRAVQGQTRPFLCRGDDGRIYFVKGRSAGRRSLVCEWLAGHLAGSLGLPVAEFEILNVPRELIQGGPPELELHDLGAGLVFGSVAVEQTTEFSWGNVSRVPEALQRDILLFDWWIGNGDRNLTELGGNPNLLWKRPTSELIVIDHNLAFATTLSEAAFFDTHVFRAQADRTFNDLIDRSRLAERLANALPAWDLACESVPDEWWFADDDFSVGTNFDRTAVRAMLARCLTKDFWRMTW